VLREEINFAKVKEVSGDRYEVSGIRW